MNIDFRDFLYILFVEVKLIRYRLYENGGYPVPMDEDNEEVISPKPLKVGMKIKISGGVFKILRVTRKDIAILFNNDSKIGGIAIVQRL